MKPMKWSRALALSLFALAAPALAAETGSKVSIQLASGELPDPQAVMKSLEAVGGGEKAVKVTRQKAPEGQSMTLELWGPFVPTAEIAATLRQAFPALATADIQVSALDTPPPTPDVRELEGTERTVLPDGRVKVIKKVVKEQKQ